VLQPYSVRSFLRVVDGHVRMEDAPVVILEKRCRLWCNDGCFAVRTCERVDLFAYDAAPNSVSSEKERGCGIRQITTEVAEHF
jgi:hypothetical protein